MENNRISLDDYLNNNHTFQGLPNKNIKDGELYYWNPVSGSVAGFDANSGGASLDCDRYPSSSNDSLGVRAVKLAGDKK